MTHTNGSAAQRVTDRGHRYAIEGQIRPYETKVEYAATAEQAEKVRQQFQDEWRYYNIRVHPPVGSVDLANLGRERQEAMRELERKAAALRDGVLRALEEGRAEAEVARTAGVDRMTVRKWASKS